MELNLFSYCFFFMFWLFGHEECGILVPWPDVEPTSPTLEGEVLTTGSSGKSTVVLTVVILSVKSSVKDARKQGETGTAWETHDKKMNKLQFPPLRIHRPVDRYIKLLGSNETRDIIDGTQARKSLQAVWLTLSERIRDVFIDEPLCGKQIMEDLESDSKKSGH